MTDLPNTALERAAQAAHDEATAQRLDDVAARLQHEATQLRGDPERAAYAVRLWRATWEVEECAASFRALVAGREA